MKKGIWWAGLLVCWALVADAQVKTKANADNKKTSVKTQTSSAKTGVPATTNLLQTGQYNAKLKGNTSMPLAPYTISDPTVRTLNLRANGAPVAWDSKEVMGVPKIVYGLANGQILFRSRGATTSGTSMGSGTVGTGSSTGPVGMHGLALGVNGKSPYAGPIMDGMIVTDINDQRATTTKKERKLRLKRNQ